MSEPFYERDIATPPTVEHVYTLDRRSRKMIEIELRTFGLVARSERCSLPPPSDIDAEEKVLSEVLHGAAIPNWFDSDHCRQPLVAAALELCAALHARDQWPAKTEPLPIRILSHALGTRFRGEAVEGELLEIAQRCSAPQPIDDLCRRIRALYYRSQALIALGELDALLRQPDADDLTIAATHKRLGAALTEAAV